MTAISVKEERQRNSPPSTTHDPQRPPDQSQRSRSGVTRYRSLFVRAWKGKVTWQSAFAVARALDSNSNSML